jgi:hypothetical protein
MHDWTQGHDHFIKQLINGKSGMSDLYHIYELINDLAEDDGLLDVELTSLPGTALNRVELIRDLLANYLVKNREAYNE